jgi:hypothetical protein
MWSYKVYGKVDMLLKEIQHLNYFTNIKQACKSNT